jgi:hypothetical protein
MGKSDQPPPAYSIVSEDTAPLLPNAASGTSVPTMGYPNLFAGYNTSITPTYQVHLVSTNQSTPIRFIDGQLHLTVLEPVRMFCTHCNTDRNSVVESQAGCQTYAASVCSFFFCPLFCCVPFCIDGLKNKVHVCDTCGNNLAHVSAA